VAALIKEKTGLETDVVEGGRGEFTVWLDGRRVAQKDANGFPSDDQVLASVQAAQKEDAKRAG
jgi:hypothetical protein